MGASSRPQGSRLRAASSAAGTSGLPTPPPPHLSHPAHPNRKSAQGNLAAQQTIPCKEPKAKAPAGSSRRSQPGSKQTPALVTLGELERLGKLLPPGFSPAPPQKLTAKSEQQMLAEVAAESSPGQSLTAISAQQRAVEAAVQEQYRVGKRVQPSAPASSQEEEDRRCRLAEAAQRAAEKVAAQDRAAALTAGKGRGKGSKQPKTAEQQAEREARVAARRAEREARATAETKTSAQVTSNAQDKAEGQAEAPALTKAGAAAEDKAAAKAGSDAAPQDTAQAQHKAHEQAEALAPIKAGATAEGKAAASSQAADAKAESGAQPSTSSLVQHKMVEQAADSTAVGSAQGAAGASHPTPLNIATFEPAQAPCQAGMGQTDSANQGAHSTAEILAHTAIKEQIFERGSREATSQQPQREPSPVKPAKPQTGSALNQNFQHASASKHSTQHAQQQAAAQEAALAKEAATKGAATLDQTAASTTSPHSAGQIKTGHQSPAVQGTTAASSDYKNHMHAPDTELPVPGAAEETNRAGDDAAEGVFERGMLPVLDKKSHQSNEQIAAMGTSKGMLPMLDRSGDAALTAAPDVHAVGDANRHNCDGGAAEAPSKDTVEAPYPSEASDGLEAEGGAARDLLSDRETEARQAADGQKRDHVVQAFGFLEASDASQTEDGAAHNANADRQPEARQAADALHQDNVEASDCVETADASEAEGRAAGQVDTDRRVDSACEDAKVQVHKALEPLQTAGSSEAEDSAAPLCVDAQPESSGSGDIEGSPQQHDHSEGIPEQHDDGEAIPEQHDGDAETQLPVSDAAMGFQAGSGTSAQSACQDESRPKAAAQRPAVQAAVATAAYLAACTALGCMGPARSKQLARGFAHVAYWGRRHVQFIK
ncbi:hypothetical protein ABBQ38_006165 [Trebouxia sp. C0009 RCD-2024]